MNLSLLFTQLLRPCTFLYRGSQCCPRPSSTTWKLTRNTNSQLCLKPSKWEGLGVQPSNLHFNGLQMIPMLAHIWEPVAPQHYAPQGRYCKGLASVPKWFPFLLSTSTFQHLVLSFKIPSRSLFYKSCTTAHSLPHHAGLRTDAQLQCMCYLKSLGFRRKAWF